MNGNERTRKNGRYEMEYSHSIEAGLETISHGELLAQANEKIAEAIANCIDPNTEAKAPRAVTVKIVIKPNERRDTAVVSYQVDLKLPSDTTGGDVLNIRPSDGRGYVPRGEQLDLDSLSRGEEAPAELDAHAANNRRNK